MLKLFINKPNHCINCRKSDLRLTSSRIHPRRSIGTPLSTSIPPSEPAILHCSSWGRQCSEHPPHPHRRTKPEGNAVGADDVSRRQALTAAALLLCAVSAPATTASEAKTMPDDDKKQLDQYLEKLMDEIRSQVPKEVKDLDQLMKLPDHEVDAARLDAVRLQNGFKRTIDGRLLVRSPKNKWFAVKTDMYMSGYILLQDSQGLVYYLAPADARDLQQVDLSDDMVVAMLFHSGEWAGALRPLEMEAAAGPQQLKLSEADFRDLLSVLQEPEESEDDG